MSYQMSLTCDDVSARLGGALQEWRRQIGSQRRYRYVRGPRPFAAFSYMTLGPVFDGLLDIRRITFCIMYDSMHAGARGTRVAGYRAARVPWGVLLGGA